MDVIVMDKLEDIASSIEYNGGGYKYPFRKCAVECRERCKECAERYGKYHRSV